jgi:RNA polymerase sigma factor (sigma-70 family)
MARETSCAVVRDLQHLFDIGTLAGASDTELLQRFLTRRDEEAFAALVARHGPMVLLVCRRVTRDAHAAEDAFQAAFLLLVRKAPQVRGSLGGWLRRVAYRVALRAQKQHNRRRVKERPEPHPGSGIPSSDPEPFEMAQTDQVARDLHQEIARLDDNHRIAVVLCELEGLTHEQAAAQLNWPLGTVKGRLARARERLRRGLGRRGHTSSAPFITAALSAEQACTVPAALTLSTLRAACDLTSNAAPLTASLAILVNGESLAMTVVSPKFVTLATVALVGIATAGWAAFATTSNSREPVRAVVAQEKAHQSRPRTHRERKHPKTQPNPARHSPPRRLILTSEPTSRRISTLSSSMRRYSRTSCSP